MRERWTVRVAQEKVLKRGRVLEVLRYKTLCKYVGNGVRGPNTHVVSSLGRAGVFSQSLLSS